MNPDPVNLKKLLELGSSHLSHNRIVEAIDVFMHASRLAPQSVAAWDNLGKAYLRFGKLEAAQNCFGKALQLDGDNPSVVYNYAGSLAALGEYEEAVELLEKVVALDKAKAPAAIASIADALEKLGREEEAHARLEPLLELESPPAKVVLSFSQLVIHYEQFAEDLGALIELLKEIAQSVTEDDQTRARAFFRLGHIYRKTKDYDHSFRSYEAAHKLINIDYDLSDLLENIDKLKTNFATEFNQFVTGESFRNIFILGLPRSGTSLVEKIVGVNQDVVSLGECNFFHHAVCEVTSNEDVMWGCREIEDASRQHVKRSYKQKYLVKNRLSRYVCDKSLENVFLVGQIMQVFPEARMIWTRRDLRDVCLSCYTSDFAGRHSYTHDLKVLGEYARKVEDLMLYWLELFPNNFHVVDYENFVKLPDKGIRSLVDFLGFDWDDAYLEFYLSNNKVKTLSYNDVQKPVYKDAVGRWMKYEKWLNPLFEGLAC